MFATIDDVTGETADREVEAAEEDQEEADSHHDCAEDDQKLAEFRHQVPRKPCTAEFGVLATLWENSRRCTAYLFDAVALHLLNLSYQPSPQHGGFPDDDA